MGRERLLITGGLGFIFRHVAAYFCEKDDFEVVVLDALYDGSSKDSIKELEKMGAKVVIADINEINKLEDSRRNYVDEGFDYVIHAAAESNVDKSIEGGVEPFIQSNILGTHEMVQYALSNHRLKKFIYINTDEVYGASEEYLDPSDATMPGNPYSASKASGGAICWAYANTYKLPVYEVRMCNIIGVGQANSKLVPRAIEHIQSGKEFPVYDGGLNTREYMDVRNVAPILHWIIMHEDVQNIYNLTFNQELSIFEVLGKISYITGKPGLFRDEKRLGHDSAYRMIPHDIMNNFKMIPFDETIKWMLKLN